MLQIRIPLDHVEKVVCELALEQVKWSDICKEYPAYDSSAKDDQWKEI